jgi:magnesium-transporting ATPase (P-type)
VSKRLLGCSPDEIQLVEYAHKQGFKLEQRDKDFIQITNTLGFKENYDILADFPFQSSNKKQSILV